MPALAPCLPGEEPLSIRVPRRGASDRHADIAGGVLIVAPVLAGLMGLVPQEVPLPGTSSVTVPLSPPNACGRCHRPNDEADQGGIYDTWAGSAMGHAARDPVFLAALQISEADAPGSGDFCLRCHAPEAWLQGRCVETDGRLLQPSDSGVTCSVCHRMEENPWVKNAQYLIADDSVMRGPYEQTEAPHAYRQSDWISDSRLCGTCHDVFNPLVFRREEDGSATRSFFPEQTTYSEWAASAFAREGVGCKDCHMPESAGQVAGIGPVRPDRSNHGFFGVNTFLLDAIDFLYPELGFATQLANGKAASENLLRRAATLELIDVPRLVGRGEAFEVRLRVVNEGGHKLPTGYPEGRRIFLQVHTSTDAPVLDDRGEPVEPLAIYQAVHGQHGVGPGHHLALNDRIFSDSRIPARGMVPTATIAPVGKVYPRVAGEELAHWDEAVYAATVPCDADGTPLTGEAVLYYEVLTKEYGEFLVRPNLGLPRGDLLQLAIETLEPRPFAMTSTTFQVTIDPSSACAPPDAGVIDSGMIDAGTAADAAAGADASAVVRFDSGVGAGPDEGCSCTVSQPRSSADAPLIGLVTLLVALRGLGRRARRDG